MFTQSLVLSVTKFIRLFLMILLFLCVLFKKPFLPPNNEDILLYFLLVLSESLVL